GAIVRLRDLGVEPFLLGSSLRLVLAQRLVRRLCEDCKQRYDAPPDMLKRFGLSANARVYAACGCPSCGHTGYKGRLGVFEAVAITPQLRTLMLDGANEATLAREAFKTGQSLSSAAAQLVEAGHTSLEEALRVTRAEGAVHG
ncbi:MAG: type II secretion system protein GspE, partial [Pseudomonadota bacterium]